MRTPRLSEPEARLLQPPELKKAGLYSRPFQLSVRFHCLRGL